MRKFKKSDHYCATPSSGSPGAVHRCGCGKVYRFHVSNRTDRHGRPIDRGSWLLVSG